MIIKLQKLSELIQEKNQIDNEIAEIIQRPAQIGHVGEFIASIIFDVQLMESASYKAIDGIFRSGLQGGKSVNIKWYGKQEGILDITPNALPDFYLIMTGPRSNQPTSRSGTRPWSIEFVYIFLTSDLVSKLTSRGSKIGIAASIPKSLWDQAEIYPNDCSPMLPLLSEQKHLLSLFHGGK
ncbi:MAG: hypothetical protein M1281_04650 [Chloroflexi bacterium]|nr:hypothetical protein [Chloroflexota bacterium]